MKRVLYGIFCLFSLFITPLFADDAGVDVPPEQIAHEEALASVSNYGQTLCHNPNYYCRAVSEYDHWYSLFPNRDQREMVMRLNRTNVSLRYRNWLAIPKHFNRLSYLAMSPLPEKMDTQGKKEVVVDLEKFAFGAYDENGKLIYWGPASSGRDRCFIEDKSCRTEKGTFKIFRMAGKDCVSNEYPLETHGGAPMPYCMFVHGGIALHASTLSGFINRSSGCIRLFEDDAKWLNEQFAYKGLTVIVQ